MSFFDVIEVAHAGVITDAPSLSAVGINVLNFLLSVFGIIAIIMLLVSSSIYFFSAGREELNKKAKRSVTYAIAGVALAMSVLIVVRFLEQFFK